jgi:hypothetical protein
MAANATATWLGWMHRRRRKKQSGSLRSMLNNSEISFHPASALWVYIASGDEIYFHPDV